MRQYVVLGIAGILVGCAPQAELVKLRGEMNDLRAEVRDTKTRVPDISGVQKRQDQLEAGMKDAADLQQRVADQGARFDQLQTDLQIIQGRIEENNYQLKELAQKIDDKSFQLAEIAAKVEQIENKLKSAPVATVHAGGTEKKPEPKTLSPTEAYQQAKADYDKGNFDLAIDGFQNYLKQFPDASQADSARYWIGECFYSKKAFDKAIEAFGLVLKNHPKSDKAPGARLKIGYSYLNQKNTAKAKENLNRVVKDYPASKEAELAKAKLKAIGK
jgi:tol-pal system protein YbgF